MQRVSGDYIKSVALASTNAVTIAIKGDKNREVAISTSLVHGYRFSGSGTLTSIGGTKQYLNGQRYTHWRRPGYFIITGISSSCSFPVTVTAVSVYDMTISAHHFLIHGRMTTC
jgi:hypothetical protein